MSGERDDLLRAIRAAWAERYAVRTPDDLELQHRLARSHSVASRPPRGWCLAVRACDTRINKAFSLTIPADAADPDVLYPHTVLLDHRLLRRLCGPVYTAPGGEPIARLAARLGTTRTNFTTGRASGRFRTRYVLPPGCAGRKIPLLSCDDPLDPGARGFVSPDPLWNLTGEFLPDLLPADFEQTVQRIPLFAPPPRPIHLIHPRPSRRLPPPPPDLAWYKWKDGVYIESEHEKRLARRRVHNKEYRRLHPQPSQSKGSLRFLGWRFLCPSCSGRVSILYLPLPAAQLGLTVCGATPSQISNLISQIPQPLSTFACGRCHHLRTFSVRGPNQWNNLITCLTAGLLLGREVPRPGSWTTQRKRPFRPRINVQAPRRQEVLRRVLAGQSTARIADDLRVTPSTVYNHLAVFFRQENVHTRLDLIRKLGGAPPPDRILLTTHRRQKVLDLLLQGLSCKEIATRLSASPAQITGDAQRIYRQHGITSRHARAELAAKYNIPLAASPYERLRSQIATMRDAGMKPSRMAAELGMTRQALNYHLKRLARLTARPAPQSPALPASATPSAVR